jgi:SAM-dependent methyltransferase
MNSTHSTFTCPACGKPSVAGEQIVGRDNMHGLPGAFTVTTCTECGSGATLPFLPASELGQFYPEGYYAYTLPEGWPARALALALIRRRGDKALRSSPLNVLASMPTGKLLDVGCGRGDIGSAFIARGWTVSGIEPSEDACIAARERNINAFAGTLEEAPFPREHFDAILFQHSLEHVAVPQEDIHRALELLCPGGVLIVSVPNFGSWQRRRFQADWRHLDVPRHRTHFSSSGLQQLLVGAGFAQTETCTTSSPDGLPMTLYHRITHRSVPSSRWIGYALMVVMPILGLVGRAADRYHGHGDVLHAVARKPSA